MRYFVYWIYDKRLGIVRVVRLFYFMIIKYWVRNMIRKWFYLKKVYNENFGY